jgi:hypothetical protein
MSEEKLQVGQSVKYEIARRTLTLKPLPLGKMKRATLIFAEPSGGDMETIAKYVAAILDNGLNANLTTEWIMENVSLPEAQRIIEDSRTVNGLGSFFQRGEPSVEIKTERPLEETTPTPSA